MPDRYHPHQLAHALRGTIKFSDSTVTLKDSIPAGSIVLSAHAVVKTAFNAGTTNVVKLGDGTTPGRFMDTADIAETSVGPNTKLLADLTTVSTPVVATFTQTGTAATTGELDYVIVYYPHGG